MKAIRLQVLLVFLSALPSFSQTWKHYTWYDKSRTKMKEIFTLKFGKDTSIHVLDGVYELYYDNGMQKASGYYKENEADSTWVYYFENGNTKCIGAKKRNLANGYWKYYFENGSLNMQGSLIKNVKEGFWRFYYENGKLKKEGLFIHDSQNGPWTYYYEDGSLKAHAVFKNDTGSYTEYYTEGTLKSKGKIINGQSDSIWVYYHPNGKIKAKGLEVNGLKSGYWTYYYENGNLNSEGSYINGQTSGLWKYYHQNGKISAEGVDSAGVREGFWRLFYDTGNLKGEGDYIKGSGDYSEYHENGKLKIEGKINKGKNDGLWKYYYDDGNQEGICDFTNGEGKFKGFYPNGRLKMEGIIKDGEKVGVWNLYKEDGSLAGHLQTIYEKSTDPEPVKPIVVKKDTIVEKPEFVNPYRRRSRFRISYFEGKKNEYRSFAIGVNPLALILGSFPVYVEYYLQERLGLELNPILYRDPLFSNEANLPYNQPFKKGYAISFKSKFYNRNKDLMGLIYFGYELRYTSNTYLANVLVNNMSRQISSNEELYDFALIFGDRLLQNYATKGWTLDLFMGIGIGYRAYRRNYEENPDFDHVFEGIRKQSLNVPIRIGFSAGYLF